LAFVCYTGGQQHRPEPAIVGGWPEAGHRLPALTFTDGENGMVRKLAWGDRVTLIALLLSLTIIVLKPYWVDHDIAMFLQLGDRLLDGDRPYIDYYEVNLPLTQYIHVFPVWLARTVGLNPILVFQTVFLSIVAWSAWMTRRLLDRLLPQPKHRLITLIPAGIASYSLIVLIRNDFGERDQLFVLLFLPWLVFRWGRWQGERYKPALAVGMTLVAFVGAVIKPHLALVPLVPELYWWRRRRSLYAFRQPETATIALAGAAYVMFHVLYPVELRDALFRDLLPRYLEGYDAYGAHLTASYELLAFGTLGIGLVSLLALWLASQRTEPVWELAGALACAALAALAVYYVQNKGWFYHLIPASMMGFLLFLMVVFRGRLAAPSARMPGHGRQRTRSGVIVPVVTITCGLVFTFSLVVFNLPNMVKVFSGEETELKDLRELIEMHTRPGDTVLAVDTSYWPATGVLTQIDRQLGGRYLHAFPIAFAYKGEVDEDSFYQPSVVLPEEAARFLRELAEDLDNQRPVLLLIDHRETCKACPDGLQISHFLEAQGFMEAHVWDRYVLVGQASVFDVYRLEPETIERTESEPD
jgi:hypothetical protein